MPADAESRWMPAWLALVRTYTRLWEQVQAQMRRDNGLTMARYDVLAHLDMAGGRLRAPMEAADLVRRDPDPRDARAAFAAITPRGQALVRKARDSHHQFLRQT